MTRCGSCWAFSSAGTFEQVLKQKTGLTFDLAEQYLVSCNSEGMGCNGGWNDIAMDYWTNRIPAGEPAAGAVAEASYPYQALNTACNAPHPHTNKLTRWAYVDGQYGTVPSVSALKDALLTYGALSVDVCVNSAFQSYRSGVFTGPSCTSINHAVILTGWDDTDGAWYLRNSWGTGWGESGLMRIKYGVSLIGYSAVYVVYDAAGATPTTAPSATLPSPTSTPVPPTFTPVAPTGCPQPFSPPEVFTDISELSAVFPSSEAFPPCPLGKKPKSSIAIISAIVKQS